MDTRTDVGVISVVRPGSERKTVGEMRQTPDFFGFIPIKARDPFQVLHDSMNTCLHWNYYNRYMGDFISIDKWA